MTTLAQRLGHWVADLRYEDLPPEVVHQAKRMIVDTLGCALGGYESEPTRIALAQAATVTSTEPATILCTGQQTSPDLAVFTNGVMIRYLDFNDGYIGREAGHPSDSIAALLSAAEIGKAQGKSAPDPRAVAEGFLRVAVANMANAIKQVSIQKGHDATRFALQCFGGAGGQLIALSFFAC